MKKKLYRPTKTTFHSEKEAEKHLEREWQKHKTWLRTPEGRRHTEKWEKARRRHNLLAFGGTEMQGRILSKDMMGFEFQWEIGPFADGSVVPCRVLLDWKQVGLISTKEVGEDCELIVYGRRPE